MTAIQNKAHILFYIMCVSTFIYGLGIHAFLYISLGVLACVTIYGMLEITRILKAKKSVALGVLHQWFYWVASSTLMLSLFNTEEQKYSHYSIGFALFLFVLTLVLYYAGKEEKTNWFPVNRFFISGITLSAMVAVVLG